MKRFIVGCLVLLIATPIASAEVLYPSLVANAA